MSLSPGEEFKIRATPSPELQRKLLYLAAQDTDSVLTGGVKSPKSVYRATSDKAATTAEALMMARLADPGYQELSARINENLSRMDEASVRALQEIEDELLELRRERKSMLEHSYKDEQGRRIFMTKDGSAAHYEDGTKLTKDEFARHKQHLRGKPTWEKFQSFEEREKKLSRERDRIHAHDADREKLREDLAAGRISKEEAQRRERELERSRPERLRAHHDAPASKDAKNGAVVNTALSADEAAELSARNGPARNNGQPPEAAPPPGATPPQP